MEAEINEVLLQALISRVQAKLMTINHVPIPYQPLVLLQVEGGAGEPGESQVS